MHCHVKWKRHSTTTAHDFFARSQFRQYSKAANWQRSSALTENCMGFKYFKALNYSRMYESKYVIMLKAISNGYIPIEWHQLNHHIILNGWIIFFLCAQTTGKVAEWKKQSQKARGHREAKKVVKALKNNPKSMGRYVWKAVEWPQRLHPFNWIIMRN